MKWQVYIETDASLDVLAADAQGNYLIGNDVVNELSNMDAEWPNQPCPDGGTMAPGTRVFNGRKRNHVIVDIPREAGDPLALLTALLATYDLDWDVVGMQPLYVSDSYEYNEELGQLEWMVPEVNLDATHNNFLEDVYDATGVPQRPASGQGLHVFAGGRKWSY